MMSHHAVLFCACRIKLCKIYTLISTFHNIFKTRSILDPLRTYVPFTSSCRVCRVSCKFLTLVTQQYYGIELRLSRSILLSLCYLSASSGQELQETESVVLGWSHIYCLWWHCLEGWISNHATGGHSYLHTSIIIQISHLLGLAMFYRWSSSQWLLILYRRKTGHITHELSCSKLCAWSCNHWVSAATEMWMMCLFDHCVHNA